VLLDFQIPSKNNQAIYIDDNIPIHIIFLIIFLRIVVTLFEREKKPEKHFIFPIQIDIKEVCSFSLFFIFKL